MNNLKTFRLFISSTFNDFRCEREILQTKVFPKIKEYCSQKKYTFQPIDLRWGINEEAQLDQKTLELCLNEVKSCKSYPYPNFLVMLGDRYGWVPLPYSIEKDEFELILEHTKYNDAALTIEYKQYKVYDTADDPEKFHYKEKNSRETSKLKLLEQWYTLDENQIPASYILNERDKKSDYKIYENWETEESILRNMLQDTVTELNFSEDQKKKYFISATEAEIEEGILPYIGLTEYQKRLVEEKLEKESLDIQKVDPEHVFGFLRNIESSIEDSDMFIGDDREKALSLKERVKGVLPVSNVFESDTVQINEKKLDENYLVEFEKSIFYFLKEKIDEQLKNEDRLTELELEKQAQRYFAEQKRNNFLGQERTRNKIEEYIENNDSRPLILYGESGKGKSALMSQVIADRIVNKTSKQLLYRFVGATPYSSSSREILCSLFLELGKDVRNNENKYKQVFQDNENTETFQVFSERIHNEILKIKKDLVIFIDAVDQLSHDDYFIWLPSDLPKNVKIIISTLKDEKYSDASQYYIELSKKTENRIRIDDFEQPLELLNKLLKNEKRQIQEHQKRYFLKRYNKVKSPLYITVAAQEMKHWKSYDGVDKILNSLNGRLQKLADSQEGIIREYIENLSSLYHHDERFVKKIFGYLYASRDGLSESELLELISVDISFVRNIVSETWHQNNTNEFPIVVWTRLYGQLKPFLSKKNKYGEELLYFFYREFDNVISKTSYIEYESTQVIFVLQKLLLKYQKVYFDNNRWADLHMILINEYMLRYKNKKQHKENSEFITMLKNKDWVFQYILQLSKIVDKFYLYNNTISSNIYGESLLYITDTLFKQDDDRWAIPYIRTLINLALSYRNSSKVSNAIELQELSLQILNKLYEKDSELWAHYYTRTLNNLSLSYSENDMVSEAISLGEKSFKIQKGFYEQKNSNQWIEYFIAASNNLASFYKKNNEIFKTVKIEEENYNLLSELYKNNPNRWVEDYTLLQNNLGHTYVLLNKFDKAIGLYESNLKIRKKLFQKNPMQWMEELTTSLINLAYAYKLINKLSKAILYEEKSIKILHKVYVTNTDRWAYNYTVALSNLASSYSNNNQIDNAIQLQKECLEISKKQYMKYPENWHKYYLSSLMMLADLYMKTNENNKTNDEEMINIFRQLYSQNIYQYSDTYTMLLNSIIIESVKNNDILNAIYYGEESVQVLKELCLHDKDNWIENYVITLNSLISAYTSSEQYSKVLEYGEECKKLLKKYYLEESTKWANEYTIILHSLSVSYFKKQNITKAIEISKENMELLKVLYEKNPSQWMNDYNLALRIYKLFIDERNELSHKIYGAKKNILRKVKRNILCPCGSGKKYKKCCGKNL